MRSSAAHISASVPQAVGLYGKRFPLDMFQLQDAPTRNADASASGPCQRSAPLRPKTVKQLVVGRLRRPLRRRRLGTVILPLCWGRRIQDEGGGGERGKGEMCQCGGMHSCKTIIKSPRSDRILFTAEIGGERMSDATKWLVGSILCVCVVLVSERRKFPHSAPQPFRPLLARKFRTIQDLHTFAPPSINESRKTTLPPFRQMGMA